jgi:hypothetical protein
LSRTFDIILKNAVGLTSFVLAIHILSKKWTRTNLDFFFGLSQSKTPPKMPLDTSGTDYKWFSGVLKTIGAKKKKKNPRLISRRGGYNPWVPGGHFCWS